MNQTEKLRQQILSQKPTDEQEEAIFTDELEFLLRASPGSGKTWTSCRRFIWRGANWDHTAGGLALLSFTNTAIREFHDATINVGRRDLLSDPNYIGTFDSFVERFIISPFGHLIAGIQKRPKLFIAPRPGDRNNRKLQAWQRTTDGHMMPVLAWEIIPYPHDGNVIFQTFNGKRIDSNGNNALREFFKLGYYTHAQRVYFACMIINKYPHITMCISRRFPEIIVDEAQDTNIWLLILLNCLHKNGTKVTLVGDPDQCIYEFSMANPKLISKLKDEWGIPEKPLSISFRCNNPIAESVRSISCNVSFVGCGKCENEYQRPFILREPSAGFGESIKKFEQLLSSAGIQQSNSVILCRAHNQLEAISGEANYNCLKGLTKEMALAAFHRDVRKDYKKAQQIVEKVVREMTGESGFGEKLDDNPESNEAYQVKLALWKFVKSKEGLPSVNVNGTEWIENLKKNLKELFTIIGISNLPKMGSKIKKTGLKADQLELPLFLPHTIFPRIRQETIHQVKGESIDGVLVLGSSKFFNAVVKAVESNIDKEDRRLAYVAMTRARHVLLIGLPASHYDKYVSTWKKWGFGVL